MNTPLSKKLLKRVNTLEPPGCCSTVVEHPLPGYRHRESVPVGFMLEHRFAFYYWLKRKQELMYDSATRTRWRDDDFSPPDLITWDWHDDSGADSDYSKTELKRLRQDKDGELALFCWAGLNPLNDGHIAPAIWLNAIGNVYIVQKQYRDCHSRSHTMVDRYGKPHNIVYCRSLERLVDSFRETYAGTGVIWDIDLDFFTRGRRVPDQRYTPPLNEQEIMSLLSADKEWMPMILGDLKAITIALEPEYTGGLSRSLDLYRAWERAMFRSPLFSKNCRWRSFFPSR